MVRAGPSTTALLALALLSTQATGFVVNFINRCTYPVDLFDARDKAPIAVGATVSRTIAPNSNAHAFRHSTEAQATLAEFSADGGRAWFDISIIPTGPKSGPDYCSSLQACKDHTGGVGFNIAMQIAPKTPDNDRCRVLTCMADGCPDAYQFPKDDTKTHTCPLNTDFDVTFCPGGSGGVTQAPTPPPTTKAPTPPPTTQAPTPPPTTVTPTPTPTPTEALESGKLASSSGSSANLRTGDAGEDRSITDETDESTTKETTTTTTTETTTTETVGAEATSAPTTSDAGTVQAGGDAGSVNEATTRSEASSGPSTGVYLIAIVGAVAAVAATAIVVVRKKKAELDALDDKTPAATTNNRGMMMTTPAGSCIL